MPKLDKLAHTIAKYVVSPLISLSRLIAYDRQQGRVKYRYEYHRQGRQEVVLSREEFIGRRV